MAQHFIRPLQTHNKDKTQDVWGTLRKLWGLFFPHRKRLFVVLVFVCVSSLLSLAGPYLVGKTIDHYIVTREANGLLGRLSIIALVYAVLSLTLYFQSIGMVKVAQEVVFSLRNRLFHHFHQLPIQYFQKRQYGEIMSRVTNDVDNINQTLNNSIIQVFSSVVTLVGAIIIMLSLSPVLTLVTLTVVPLMYMGMKWITNRTRPLFKEQQRNLGELNGYIEETVSGHKIIQLYSQEQVVIRDFIEKNKKLSQSGYWAQTISGFIPKLLNLLNNLSFALIAGIGGILVLQDVITIGAIVIFVEYARQFVRPLNDLANQYNTMLAAVAGAERVFEILKESTEEGDEHEAIALNAVIGEVEFRNVSFSYEKKRNAIEDVTFRVMQGQTVAIIGPTGAGKTTIINLLTRFYDPDAGVLFLDGHNLRGIKRGSLRKHMAFVQQDTFLFETTVRENIRYGRLDASDEDVEEAAKLANAHSFIMQLPDGYDTVLTDSGSTISQGQRQLLAIARAFVANPSILILDEATSNIDTITELKIQDALSKLMKNRTCFVIAHRLNTILNADLVLVVHDGKIIEKGTHEFLLEKRGFYYELLQSQWKVESLNGNEQRAVKRMH